MECRQQSTNHCHSKPVSDFPNADMFSRLLPGRPMSEKSDVWDCQDLLAKMEKRSLILALIRSCQCYVPAREWAIIREGVCRTRSSRTFGSLADATSRLRRPGRESRSTSRSRDDRSGSETGRRVVDDGIAGTPGAALHRGLAAPTYP